MKNLFVNSANIAEGSRFDQGVAERQRERERRERERERGRENNAPLCTMDSDTAHVVNLIGHFSLQKKEHFGFLMHMH